MAMAVEVAMWIAKMVWIALSGWISSCLTVADEVASSLRSGDIGPFHVDSKLGNSCSKEAENQNVHMYTAMTNSF
ncbi:hypothetical protein Ahy_A06g026874 [Arachis hypogaea]|uniref:Uncharacterized protein n=1 Tax=Arachis hypogaea TaxID=3818 RepID=A0A445CLW7_ARAHY|nr:hypothetical protein Ahy_A06g026874 [Arachis hypogaea]